MRVLLLNPYYRPNYIRSARSTGLSISGSNWYPIFLAYATGWLEKHGHQTKLIDAQIVHLSPQETLAQAKDFRPELLVLYVAADSLKDDLAIGRRIKKVTGCQLVLVGPWCATSPEKTLATDKAIDGVIRREFDAVVLDLANGKAKKQIKGLTFRKKEKIITNPEREFLSPNQLDQFPFVTKIYQKHLPIKKYYQASLLHPFVDLFTARGCPWSQCTFCLWPNTIHKGAPLYRPRNLNSVIEEFKFIHSQLPFIKEVFLQDDTLPPTRARQIAELLLRENFKITWSCYVRPNVDLKTLTLMKKAGCRYLHVGYESADEKILKNIRKGITPEVMKEFTKNTKKAGLRVHGDFIIGLPGETEKTIKKTIKWAKSLGIEGYQFLIPQPHQATPLHQWLKNQGYLTKKGDVSYPHLNYQKLNFWRFRAMREIYFSKSYLSNLVKDNHSFADLFRLARTAFYLIPNFIKAR